MRTIRIYFIGDNVQDMFYSPDITVDYTEAIMIGAAEACPVGFVDVQIGDKDIHYLSKDGISEA